MHNLVITTTLELQSLIENAVEVAVQRQFSLPLKLDTNPASEILDIEACSILTGLKKPTIYTKTSTKSIPHYRKGKRLYFIRSEIESWILEDKRPTKNQFLYSKNK